MSEPTTQLFGGCSYQRRLDSRRYQLLAVIWLSCTAFTWPGRVPHLSYTAAHAAVPERVQALRELEGHPSQAASDACLAGLEDDAPEVRTQAAECVGALGESRALTNLLDLAGAKLATERSAAIAALGQLAAPRALPLIERALQDAEPEVRVAALHALAKLPFDADKLAPLLRGEPAEQRVAVVELKPSSALLRAAARDKSPEVRAAALRVMGRARDARYLSDLTAALSDGDENTRLWAISALGDTGLAAAVKPLRALTASTNARSARTALAALGRIDDASALPAISEALAREQLAPAAVDALVTRARRLRQPEVFKASVQALKRAIDAGVALDALGRGVLDLSAFGDVSEATQRLRQALAAGGGDTALLTAQLLELQARDLVPTLLERAKQKPADGAAIADVIAASADAPALLSAHAEQLRQLAAPQLDALLQPAGPALWASQPALVRTPEQRRQLLAWLDDKDPRTREQSSTALALCADESTLEALAQRLEQKAPHPELTLQACAGALQRSAATLPAPLRERLLKQLEAYLSEPDEVVAMSALFALRVHHDERSARAIAGLLRGSSPALREAAVQALGDFDHQDARRMLRDMLRGDNLQSASNAALALAELGTDRDVDALLRAAERGSWPLPPAAAYAAARITQRGATRKHSLERSLCRFAQLHDTYVLANSVSALAALGAEPCDAQISPHKLLDEALPSALRTAAAHWLRNSRPHTPDEIAARAHWLERCIADHDATVSAACAPRPDTTEPAGYTLLHLHGPDGHSALRSRPVALRLPDASVFVGQSDSAGRVLLPRVVRGALQLEDPADEGAIAWPAPAP